MNNMERFHFVMWAVDNFPRFTTNPGEYEAATRAWEARKKARAFDAEYLMARMRSEDLIFPNE